MSEVDKGEVQSICWKTIFIAIAFLAIGTVFGHVMTMKCYPMMTGPRGGGPGMKACWGGGRMGPACCTEHKFGSRKGVCGRKGEWIRCKDDIGKCKPGCMRPKCSKEKACLAEPNKVSYPMMGRKTGECKKK